MKHINHAGKRPKRPKMICPYFRSNNILDAGNLSVKINICLCFSYFLHFGNTLCSHSSFRITHVSSITDLDRRIHMGYETRFRHENKFEISYGQYICIRGRLKAVCRPDPHADENGTYLIRSIYFDNDDNKALKEKITGAARREKFRIRYYNDDFNYVTLEKKQKINELCKKVECSLTKDEMCDILSGDLDFMKSHTAPLVRELYTDMKTQQLRPKVLVSYRREPYIFRPGNVRVTFDSGIKTAPLGCDFPERIYEVSATDDPGMMIMEVKYDDFLPNIISCIVNEGNIRQQSFSKYEACRKFG